MKNASWLFSNEGVPTLRRCSFVPMRGMKNRIADSDRQENLPLGLMFECFSFCDFANARDQKKSVPYSLTNSVCIHVWELRP